jgi:hypothetical protein
MRHIVSIASALLLVAAVVPAGAEDLHGNDWSFNFFNDSSVTVVQINTMRRNGKWSRNWLATSMDAGTGLTLNFKDRKDTRCEVRTYVKFMDDSSYDQVLNYCGTAIVRVTDRAMTTE